MRYLHLFTVLLVILSLGLGVTIPIQIWSYAGDRFGEFNDIKVVVKVDDDYVKYVSEYNTLVTEEKKTVPGLINLDVEPGKHTITVMTPMVNTSGTDDKADVKRWVYGKLKPPTRFTYIPRSEYFYITSAEHPRLSEYNRFKIGNEWYNQRVSEDAAEKTVFTLEQRNRTNTGHIIDVLYFDENGEHLNDELVYLFGQGRLLGVGEDLEKEFGVRLYDVNIGLNTGFTAWSHWREAVSFNADVQSTKFQTCEEKDEKKTCIDEPRYGETVVKVYLRSLNATDSNYTIHAYTDTNLDLQALEDEFRTSNDILERDEKKLVWRQRSIQGDFLFEDHLDGRIRIDLVNTSFSNANDTHYGTRRVSDFNFTSSAISYKLLLDKLEEHLHDIYQISPIHETVIHNLAKISGSDSTFYEIELTDPESFSMEFIRCGILELLGNTGGSGFKNLNTTFPTPVDSYFNLTNYIIETSHFQNQEEILSMKIDLSTDYEKKTELLVLCKNDVPPVITGSEGDVKLHRIFSEISLPPKEYLGLEVTFPKMNFATLTEEVKKRDILGLESDRSVRWRDHGFYYQAFSNGSVYVYNKGYISILSLRNLIEAIDSLETFFRSTGVSTDVPEDPGIISSIPIRWMEFRSKDSDRYNLKITNQSMLYDIGLKTICPNDLTISGLMFCGDHTILDRSQEGNNRIGLLKADTLTVTALANASLPMDMSLITKEGDYVSEKRHHTAVLPSFPIGPLCGDGICSELEERQVPGQPPSPGKIYCCEDCGCPKVVVEREFSDATPMIDEVVNVTAYVMNVGSVPAYNVIFNEVLPPGFIFVKGEKGFSGTIPAKGVVNFTYDMQAPEDGGETSYPPLLTLYFDASQNKFLVNASAKYMEVVLTEKDPQIVFSRIIKGEVALLRREIVKEMGETPDVIVLKSLSDLNPAVGDIVRAYVHVTNNLDEDIAITCVEPTSETLEFLDHTARFRDIPQIKEGRTIEYIYEMRAIRTGNFTIDPTRVLLNIGGLNQEFQSNEIKFKVLDNKANATTMFGGMNFTLMVENIGEGDAHNVTIYSAVGDDFFESKKWGEEYTWNGDLLAGEAKSVNITLTPYALGSYDLPPARVTYNDQDLKSHEVLANNTDVFYAAPAHFGLFPKIEIIGLLDKNDYNSTEDVNLEAIVFNHGEGTAFDLELNLTLSEGLECGTACGYTGSIPAGELVRVPLHLKRTGTEPPLRITLTSHCFDELGYEYVAQSFPLDVPLALPGSDITLFQVEQRYNQISETLNYNVRAFRPNLTAKIVFMFIPPSDMNFTGPEELVDENGTLILRTFRKLGSYSYKGLKDSMTQRINFPESRTQVFFVDLYGVAHSYVKESKDVLYDAKEVAAPTAEAAGDMSGTDEEDETNWLLIAMVGLVSISILGGGVYAVLSGLQGGGGTSAEDLEDTEVPDYVGGEDSEEESDAPVTEGMGGGIEGMEGGRPGLGGEGAEGGMPGMGGEGAEGGGWGDQQQQGWAPGGEEGGGEEGGAEGGGWQAPEGGEDDGSGGGGW